MKNVKKNWWKCNFSISADILNESQVEPDSTTLEPDSSLHAHLRHASLQNHLDFISEGQDDDYGVIELGKSFSIWTLRDSRLLGQKVRNRD